MDRAPSKNDIIHKFPREGKTCNSINWNKMLYVCKNVNAKGWG